jgi:hypothetical protein
MRRLAALSTSVGISLATRRLRIARKRGALTQTISLFKTGFVRTND